LQPVPSPQPVRTAVVCWFQSIHVMLTFDS
jgi:hypothetical protein